MALLELMPPMFVGWWRRRSLRVEFGFGEVIVTEGDKADALFVIQSGTARAVKAGDHGEEVPLNVLQFGRHLR